MIEITNLNKLYRTTPLNPLKKPIVTQALSDVTFNVNKGEICTLIGRNGAGKSTLLKILSTLILPSSGTAIVGGHNVVNDTPLVKRKIGIITGDERSFYWRLSGRENLILFGTLYNIPKKDLMKKVDNILGLLELTSASDAPFRTYSSGMKQRLSIARCLIHDPEILIMDEPNKGIDPLLQMETIDYIKNDMMKLGEKTVIFATHNLDEASALGGKTAVLRNGKLEYFGVYPGNEKVRALLKDSDVI